MLRKWILGFILVAMLSPLSMANNQDIARLEENIERKSNHLLASMFGANQISAIATVTLGREAWKIRYTGKAKVSVSNPTPNKKGEKYKIVLPVEREHGFTCSGHLKWHEHFRKRHAKSMENESEMGPKWSSKSINKLNISEKNMLK